jgi:hypothetical protein
MSKKDGTMSGDQFFHLAFLAIGIWSVGRGIMFISQSLREEQHITWYKRIKFTRGLYFFCLGLALVVSHGFYLAGKSMPYGAVGDILELGLVILIVLFGLLTWWNQSHRAPQPEEAVVGRHDERL